MKGNVLRLLTSFAVAISLVMPREASAQATYADSATLYQSLRPSLALVVARSGKNFALGTAFCIGSHDGVAYFLTNHHVVGSDLSPRVVLLSDQTSILYATVDRISTLDAAVIAVKNSRCSPLLLSKEYPSTGTQIGIVGFPSFQIDLAASDIANITPSIHTGLISSSFPGGSYIEYDAQTDHGNSGSPLVDVRTGVVYGLVRSVNTGTTGALQNNLAISMAALASFLDNSRANVSYSANATISASLNPPPSVLTSATDPAQAAQATPGPGANGQAPANGSVGSLIDGQCGSGVSNGILASIKSAQADLDASDTSSAAERARGEIRSASMCAMTLGGPASTPCSDAESCSDAHWTGIEAEQLMGQQILRLALARSKGAVNGDTINAVREEVSTALDLCKAPNALLAGEPYDFARITMTDSIQLAEKTDRIYRGVFDIGTVRSCAAKLGIH